MRRGLLLLTLAATLLSACSKDTTVDVIPEEQDKIYATIENDESRIELNDKKQTVWTKDDQIVVNGPNDMTLWRFNGKTGDRQGSFSRIGTFNVGSDYEDFGFDKYYALYAYDNYYTFGKVGSAPIILMNAPSTQTYKQGSYGLHANTMLGTSTDGVNYRFKNIHGYLCLKLTGNKVVSKIELTGNNDENIAGLFYFMINDTESHHWYDNTSSVITLDCGNGVALSDIPTEFYFVVPPTSFNNGISISVHFTDGEIYPKMTKKLIKIERNHIQPMATISTGEAIEWQKVYIFHTGTAIETPLIGEGTAIGDIDWGDGTITKIGELTSRYYTDGEPSHTITIKTVGTDVFQLKSCEGVTKLDLSEF